MLPAGCGSARWTTTKHDPTGALYRFDSRGLNCCDDGYVITNGPATSPDGRTLYHVDTLQRVIYAFDLDDGGTLANRRVFAQIDSPGVYPDGPAVDAIRLRLGRSVRRLGRAALFAAGRVARQRSQLPVANCTKAVFGGDDLRTMYVTTAWKGLSDEQRAQQPLAGGLFALRVDTSGLPHEYRFAMTVKRRFARRIGSTIASTST